MRNAKSPHLLKGIVAAAIATSFGRAEDIKEGASLKTLAKNPNDIDGRKQLKNVGAFRATDGFVTSVLSGVDDIPARVKIAEAIANGNIDVRGMIRTDKRWLEAYIQYGDAVTQIDVNDRLMAGPVGKSIDLDNLRIMNFRQVALVAARDQGVNLQDLDYARIDNVVGEQFYKRMHDGLTTNMKRYADFMCRFADEIIQYGKNV